MKTAAALFLALLIIAGQAGPRTSASYSITTDATDFGGQRTTSAAYTIDASLNVLGGLSTVATPVEFAKAGYAGQLYDPVALTLTAPSDPATVNGGATLQLAAWQVLDDASFLSVAATSVAWSVTTGPITGISLAGLATAGPVYQNTAATVQGVDGALTGSLGVTVTDLNNDSFGVYAGDGIPDSWQVQYFGLGTNGLGNPFGAANVDADGTGQSNLLKYLAGLNPLNSTSVFQLTIAPISGQSGERNLIFTPVFAGRTYTVQSTGSLSAPNWQPLSGSLESDNGNTRTVTDLHATGSILFYRVQISMP